MSEIQEAAELQSALNSRGGQIIMSMLREMAKEPQDELYQIYSTSRGDSAPVATARRLSIRSRAFNDVIEAIESRLRILIPTRERGS